ncbi:MAG: hydroxymethylbilane synthase [Microbacteriaceae bacterium]
MEENSGALRVGTNNSPLAIARAQSVVASLSSGSKNTPAVEVELVVIDGSIAELTEALIARTIDIAVDSATESPTLESTVVVGAYPKRADFRDALCAADGATFDTLAEGARVVVASARRKAQVLARRADLSVEVDDSDIPALLAAVADGRAAAAVVGVADLDRLRTLDSITEFLGIDGWPTDAGQGVIAVMVRQGSEKLVKALGHNPTRTIVEAELEVREGLGSAGELAGVHGIIDDGLLFVSARVYAPDGSARVTSSHALYLDDAANPAVELGSRVVAELVELGAHDLAVGTS